MKQVLLPVFLLLLLWSCQQPTEVLHQGDSTFIPMETQRLSDLNEPRSGHALVWANNHILAVGGHTTGFVPTATAEYYDGKCWHTISTLYTHDTPFALVLNDGDVLIGGGYEKDFGVGQTWGVERYHPATHSFTPMPIMDKKRAHASALELEDGAVVISGNWYATDFTEIYNGNILWTDTASNNRSYPFILPMGNGNAWIIGATYDSYGDATKNIVDQVKGEPFEVDLLDEWHPQSPLDRNVQADACRVADNSFLILAVNNQKQYAPLLVDSRGFSLLPMEQALPKEGPWGAIRYMGSIWTVPETETAWLMGLDEQKHVYLAEIAYQPALQGGQAKLSMYYSQPLEDLPVGPYELLLPDGSFVTAGGMNRSNYDSSAAVFAFYPNAKPENYSALFAIGLGLTIVLVLLLVFVLRKRKRQKEETPNGTVEQAQLNEKTELGDKLKVLMEQKQLFRNKDLRIADVAAALGTNTTYLSTCLNGELNTSFPAFVTSYRIRYAQELMQNNPTMRLLQVAEESGFANEKTFLRTFKASCGVTPSEWKQEHGGD
jgi:AraC-like DNA-binding protein